MKSFSGISKTVFLLCGSVIGAGFIGGTELAEFFGGNGYLPYLILSAFLFFSGFTIVLLREKKNDGLTVSVREKQYTCKVFFAAEFVFCSAMLAGITEILKSFGAGGFSYLISLAVFSASCFLAETGRLRADKANAALMPAILILLNVLIITRLSRGTTLNASGELCPSRFRGTVKTFLYVFLNVFISAPAVKCAAKENGVTSLVVAAAAGSVIIAAEAFLILRVSESCGTLKESLPLLSALKNGGAFTRFCVYFALLVAAYTSFYTCLFSLKSESERISGGRAEKIAVYVLVYCFSVAGLKRIVSFVYPIFGAFGVCYVINSLIKLVCEKGKFSKSAKTVKSRGIKIKAKAHNKLKFRFGGVIKCLKREKIR